MSHQQYVTHHEHCFNGSRAARIRRGFLWGGTIILAGGLFLLEHMGLLGGYAAWHFWPGLLVIAGVGLLTRRNRRLLGLALALGGGLLLVHSLALLPLQWGFVWPVLVMGLGLLLIVGVFTRRKPRRIPSPCTADLPPDTLLMASKEERVDSQEYAGGRVSTVMGAYVLDLSRAEMRDAEATVKAKAVLGGVEIVVPSHWKVEIRSKPVMGAVENKTREPEQAEKTLVVDAEVVMGGIEIRN